MDVWKSLIGRRTLWNCNMGSMCLLARYLLKSLSFLNGGELIFQLYQKWIHSTNLPSTYCWMGSGFMSHPKQYIRLHQINMCHVYTPTCRNRIQGSFTKIWGKTGLSELLDRIFPLAVELKLRNRTCYVSLGPLIQAKELNTYKITKLNVESKAYKPTCS